MIVLYGIIVMQHNLMQSALLLGMMKFSKQVIAVPGTAKFLKVEQELKKKSFW